MIGLTTRDLRIAGRPDWRWAFGSRSRDGVAIVSSYRMGGLIDIGDDRWKRVSTMVLRDVAFLYYGLRPVSDPNDLLYDNILSLDDLDRLPDRL